MLKTFKAARNFFSFVGCLIQAIRKNSLSKFLMIVALDAISAIGKIGSVLVVALAVKMLSLEAGTSDSIYGFEISASKPLIVILGLTLGTVLIAGAACTFASAWQSRKLGRRINERSMSDIYLIFQTDPGLAAWSHFQSPANLNVLLTQVPIHAGLAVETVARLVNPILLLTFAGLSLFYQQPMFALSVVMLGLIFIPFIIRFSMGVQSNAQSFYSDKATGFGQLVNAKASMMINQHSIIKKGSDNIESIEQASEFFGSFDKNLLANERAALLISFADGFLRAFVFVVLCLLVLQQEFSAEAAVLFLGGLAYALMSARSVASLTTNLLRYYPQAKIYFQVLEKFSNIAPQTPLSDIGLFPKEYTIFGKDGINGKPIEKSISKGQITLVSSPEPLNTLSIGRYAEALFGKDYQQLPLAGAIALANGSFRFAPITVLEQLSAGASDTKTQDFALDCCKNLGADKDFASLENGYDTILNESVWRRLGAEARVALRLVPLAVSNNHAIALIDVDVIRAIGIKVIPFLREYFSDRYVFIIIANDQKFVDMAPETCMRIDPKSSTKFGNQTWLIDEINNRARNAGSDLGAINLDTLL